MRKFLLIFGLLGILCGYADSTNNTLPTTTNAPSSDQTNSTSSFDQQLQTLTAQGQKIFAGVTYQGLQQEEADFLFSNRKAQKQLIPFWNIPS